MIDAFGQADAPLGRDLGGAPWRQVEPVEMLAAGAADIEHVLEALGGDQRHGLDAVLDDGVGHQRRAVHQIVDVDGCQARGGKRRLDAGDGIVALGRHLDRAQFAGARACSATRSVKVPPMSMPTCQPMSGMLSPA